MNTKVAALPHPSGDKRFKMLEAAMKRHQFQAGFTYSRSSTQHRSCWVISRMICCHLRVAVSQKCPASRVYGVATFYNFFSLKPKGEHTCVVCMGTACTSRAALTILESIEENTRYEPGRNNRRRASFL